MSTITDRLEALADLPRLADSPQAAADGFRAALLQRDREQLERTNRLLRESLADVIKLLDYAPPRTPADDEIIRRATRALTLGALL